MSQTLILDPDQALGALLDQAGRGAGKPSPYCLLVGAEPGEEPAALLPPSAPLALFHERIARLLALAVEHPDSGLPRTVVALRESERLCRALEGQGLTVRLDDVPGTEWDGVVTLIGADQADAAERLERLLRTRAPLVLGHRPGQKDPLLAALRALSEGEVRPALPGLWFTPGDDAAKTIARRLRLASGMRLVVPGAPAEGAEAAPVLLEVPDDPERPRNLVFAGPLRPLRDPGEPARFTVDRLLRAFTPADAPAGDPLERLAARLRDALAELADPLGRLFAAAGLAQRLEALDARAAALPAPCAEVSRLLQAGRYGDALEAAQAAAESIAEPAERDALAELTAAVADGLAHTGARERRDAALDLLLSLAADGLATADVRRAVATALAERCERLVGDEDAAAAAVCNEFDRWADAAPAGRGARVHYQRALLSAEAGDWGSAAQAWAAALSGLAGRLGLAARLNRAAAIAAAGDAAGAAEQFAELARGDGDDALHCIARVDRALCLAGAGDHAGALELLEALPAPAAGQDPGWQVVALQQRGMSLALSGRADEAAAVYGALRESCALDSLERLQEAIAGALCRQAETRREAGDDDAAVAAYATVARLFGDATAPHVQAEVLGAQACRAALLAAGGDREAALVVYDQLMNRFAYSGHPALSPKLAGALMQKAALLAALGRADEELASYEQVVQRFGQVAAEPVQELVVTALKNRAFLLIKRAKQALAHQQPDSDVLLAAAAESLQGVLARMGDEPALMATLGYVQFLQGDERGARIRVLRAVLLGGEQMRSVALEYDGVIPLPRDHAFRDMVERIQRPDYSHGGAAPAPLEGVG